jgi:putative dimethyl sulfoxide reductase chaperone
MAGAVKELEKNAQEVRAAKADCCRLLAAFFYPPDKELFQEEGIGEKLEGLLRIACPEALPFVPHLTEYNEGEDRLGLSVAYTRLFLGPPVVLAPPYASFYLDRGVVMGPSSVEMMKLYGEAGLRLDDEFDEMPDHVAVVLEFLYYLLFKEERAGARNADEEKEKLQNIKTRFLKHYVFPWVPRFCGEIKRADEHPAYSKLAECLDWFIQCGFG